MAPLRSLFVALVVAGVASASIIPGSAKAELVHKRQCTTSTPPPPPPTTSAPPPPPPSSSSASAPPPPPPTTTSAPPPPPTTTPAPPPPPPPSSSTTPTPTSSDPGNSGTPTSTQAGATPSQTVGDAADPYLTSLSIPLNYPLEPQFTAKYTGGVMTYYDTGSVACGDVYDDSTYTAAVSHMMYDTWAGADTSSTNRNPICGPFTEGRYYLSNTDEVVPGKAHALIGGDNLINCQQGEQCHRPLTATITNHAINATFTVWIVDRCAGCVEADIDLSPAAFLKLTEPNLDTSNFQVGDFLAEASKNVLGRVPVSWSFDQDQKFESFSTGFSSTRPF